MEWPNYKLLALSTMSFAEIGTVIAIALNRMNLEVGIDGTETQE